MRMMIQVAYESLKFTAGKLQMIVLGSESLQNYYQMPPTSPGVFGKDSRKKASAVNQLQRVQFVHVTGAFNGTRAFWGCFSSEVPGHLVRIHRIMDMVSCISRK